MNRLMDIIWLLVLAGVGVALLRYVRRRKWAPSEGCFVPRSAPAPSRMARIVETVVLCAACALVLAISATWPSTGGMMLMLDKLRPAYAVANAVMFACALAGIAVALVFTMRGRTFAGTFIAVCVLIAYGLTLNGGSYPGALFLPPRMAEAKMQYTIDISGTNVRGAELWVNGVCLGKTPYVATLEEFERAVPYWKQPPADYDMDKRGISRHSPYSTNTAEQRRWFALQAPKRSDDQEERKTYYARVRYAGEWGLAGGSGGSGSHSSGAIRESYNDFEVVFPERQKRLDVLLDKARIAGYRVTPEWFQAAETYDEDGWLAIRKAAGKEPRMMSVLDDWATWRYGLDRVTDEGTAWSAFQRIREEAEMQQQYLTPSVAGRAVELLAPKLPREKLADEAVRLIRGAGTFDYLKWRTGDRLQFGYSRKPGGVHLDSTGAVSQFFVGGPTGARRLPAGAYPVAHAVWLLHERAAAGGAGGPNVFQRIAPEIVRWHSRSGLADPMLIAAAFGGREVDKYLLRQNRRNDTKELRGEDRFNLGPRDVNKWLYLLAHLDDAAGRKFRREYADLVMGMADQLYGESFDSAWRAQIDFIFLDPWLAREYWPRFARLAQERSRQNALRTQWHYLLRMGDTATADMFLEAWRQTDPDQLDFEDAARLLSSVRPVVREEVLAGIHESLLKEEGRFREVLKGYGSPEGMMRMLRDTEEMRAERLYAALRKGPEEEQGRIWKNVPLWLAQEEPDSPLVRMLVKSDDARLRAMALGALREHPTLAHMDWLKQLGEDADAEVRQAAEDTVAHLSTLAARSAREYVSDPGMRQP